MLIPMSKASIYALKDEREAILLSLQKSGSIMLITDETDTVLPNRDQVTDQVARTKEAIRFMNLHGKKDPLLAPRTPVQLERFMQEDDAAVAFTEQVDTLSDKIASLRNEGDTMLAQVEQLTPWKAMDIPLEELQDTASCKLFAGYLPEVETEACLAEIKDLLVEYQLFEVGAEGQAILIYAHQEAVEQLKHFLREHNYTEMVFPKRVGKPQQVAVDLTEAARLKYTLADDMVKEAAKIASRKGELQLYYDQLEAKQARMANGGKETEKTFFLTGWVRADEHEKLRAALSEVTEAFELTFTEPEEGEIPPTVMENNSLVRPFESITEMYSRPQFGSLDPDGIMAPFYFIFFGMMLSDAGYGIVLTVLLLIALKLMKPHGTMQKLMLVILFGSISTVIWGALFGGWFGLELHPLMFVPMKEPLKMLALCFALGAMHLVSGMLLKVYMQCKRGHAFDAFCDQISWLILFTGLFFMVLTPENPAGKYAAEAGAAIIVLTGGREKKGIFGKLIGGLLSLYGISSYVSDLLSYSRLFALGLATGVIAMVINTIAKMLWSVGPVGIAAAVVVLVGGHVFNILINTLGSFVHTSRLQYIEFFGKFYEAGGRAFVPLAFRTKYTDVTK